MIANGSHFTVSVIDYGTSTVTKPVEFRDAIEAISSGRWRGAISKIRTGYKAAGGGLAGKKAVARQKLQLAGILFSGTFVSRSAKNLIQHSGLICCDLDNLGNQVAAIKDSVTHDRCVLAAFLSPSGEGLKVVLRCDPTRDHEEETYPAAHLYMLEHFGVDIDDACSDVSRICYVSDDADIYVADHAECIPYPAAIKPVKYVAQPAESAPLGKSQSDRPGDDYNARADVPGLLKSHGWTPVGKTGWLRPGKDFGLSATFGYYPGFFHVFTSSSQFEANRTYKPFQVYTILECNGDFKEAARRLGRNGYGAQQGMVSAPLRNDAPVNGHEVNGHVPDECWDAVVGGPTVVEPTTAAEAAKKTEKLKSKRVRIASAPPEPVTRLFLAGKPIATPGNLVTLISRAKTGKTATIGAAVAAIVAAHYDRPGVDTLGFTAPHTNEAVVLIDTEQSPYDAFVCHQRALNRAAESEDPEWLHHYALVGESAEDLSKYLLIIIAIAKAAHGGIFTIILDGIADFVESVNDEAECNYFITWLRGIAVEFDCPIICVIHSNEAAKSGDDGRGHLGKQLTRKAESNLLLKKEGEITVITSEKQRKAPITESDGVAFKWSDAAGRHVSCGTEASSSGKNKGGRKVLHPLSKFIEFFPGPNDKHVSLQVLWNKAQSIVTIPRNTFRDLCEREFTCGELDRVIDKNLGPCYRLNHTSLQ